MTKDRARASQTGSRASTEPVSRPSPAGFDPARKWKRGLVTLAFPDEIAERQMMTTVGYSDGTFILDRRIYSKSFIQEAWGYVVSHAATGYAICGVKGPLSKAKAFVDQIRHLNWDFAAPEDLPAETKSAAVPIMRAAGCAHVTEFHKADWEPAASGMEAATAGETPKSGSTEGDSPARKGTPK